MDLTENKEKKEEEKKKRKEKENKKMRKKNENVQEAGNQFSKKLIASRENSWRSRDNWELSNSPIQNSIERARST